MATQEVGCRVHVGQAACGGEGGGEGSASPTPQWLGGESTKEPGGIEGGASVDGKSLYTRTQQPVPGLESVAYDEA